MRTTVTARRRSVSFLIEERRTRVRSHLLVRLFLLLSAVSVFAEVSARSGSIPDYATVRSKMLTWIESRSGATEESRANALKLWPAEESSRSPDELWERSLETFSGLDPSTKEFLHRLSQPMKVPQPVDSPLLYEAGRGDFYLANLRMHYARWLTQSEFTELALELMNQINAEEVISPAAYYFYKAACQRRLIQREEGLKSLEALLALPPASPERYSQLGRLMKEEWTAVEEKSLEEVSMLMADVRRRLKLAQPGQKTQNAEDQVVKRLDEIIKKLEDQNNGGKGGSPGADSIRRPGTPADDSRIHGTKGPGEIDPKSLKVGDVWGNLDEKKRAEVQNLISRDFPAHYRRTIEEYFRKLATRKPNGE